MSTKRICSFDERVYRDYIFTSLYCTAAISILPPIYSYMNAYRKNQLKAPKLLFNLGIVFYGAIFIYYIFLAFRTRCYCHNKYIEKEINDLAVYFYAIQATMLVFILFIRLRLIFNSTKLAILLCTIRIFKCSCILSLSLGIVGHIF